MDTAMKAATEATARIRSARIVTARDLPSKGLRPHRAEPTSLQLPNPPASSRPLWPKGLRPHRSDPTSLQLPTPPASSRPLSPKGLRPHRAEPTSLQLPKPSGLVAIPLAKRPTPPSGRSQPRFNSQNPPASSRSLWPKGLRPHRADRPTQLQSIWRRLDTCLVEERPNQIRRGTHRHLRAFGDLAQTMGPQRGAQEQPDAPLDRRPPSGAAGRKAGTRGRPPHRRRRAGEGAYRIATTRGRRSV